MAGRSVSHEPYPHRKFLSRRDRDVTHVAVARNRAATFGQTILSRDLIPMILDHVVDTEPRGPLLASLGEKDHVPVEFDLGAVQQQHQHQGGCHIVFVIECSTTVHVAVFHNGAERIDGPVLRLHADHIRVTHDQYRLLAPVTGNTCDKIGARRIEREKIRRNTSLRQHALKIGRRFRFVARWVTGIHANQIGKMFQRLRLNGLPVDGILVLGTDNRCHRRNNGAKNRSQTQVLPSSSCRSHSAALREFALSLLDSAVGDGGDSVHRHQPLQLFMPVLDEDQFGLSLCIGRGGPHDRESLTIRGHVV